MSFGPRSIHRRSASPHPTGANLPPEHAPWRSYGAAGLVAGFEAGAFPNVPAAIQTHGFCVVRTGGPA
jgi:hypothetical protein